MRIAVLGGKGGTGKSVLAANLAVRATSDHERVLVVDADPQGTTTSWFSRRAAEAPVLLAGVHRAPDVDTVLVKQGEPDVLVYDGSPVGIDAATETVLACDVIVVPVRPSPADIEAVGDTIDIADEHGKPCLVVLNAVGQHDGRLADKARALLARDYGTARVAAAVLRQRVAHVDAFVTGQSGAERDKSARDEVDALWREVVALAGKRTNKKKGR